MKNSKKGNFPSRLCITLSKKQCPKTSKKVEVIKQSSFALTTGNRMYVMLCSRSVTTRYRSNP